jgi:DNA-binding CsgD family transcriptional regulator
LIITGKSPRKYQHHKGAESGQAGQGPEHDLCAATSRLWLEVPATPFESACALLYLTANNDRRCLPLMITATPIRMSPQTLCSIFIQSGNMPGTAMMTAMATTMTAETDPQPEIRSAGAAGRADGEGERQQGAGNDNGRTRPDGGVHFCSIVAKQDDGQEAEHAVIDALRAGARAYLTKDAGGAEIRQALQHVLDDQAVIDPAVQHHLIDAIATAPPPQGPLSPSRFPDGLTPREAEVLSLIATGLSNTEIAELLFISQGTVKSHINRLLAKIGARDRAQAVAYAYQRGLV